MKTICRPGGFEITDRAIELCAFRAGASILDCGCGEGATVDYLNSRGFHAVGIDKDGGAGVIKAAAEKLPFEDGSFEGVFFECSLSKMEAPDRALAEAARVLRSEGRIAVSDFYAYDTEFCFSGELLGRAERAEKTADRIEKAGFKLLFQEDFSKCADELFASLVLKYGLDAFLDKTGTDRETFKKVRCGYALFVGMKR